MSSSEAHAPSLVYAVATMDTKGEELAYVAACLRKAGARVKTIDVGTRHAPTVTPDVTREQVAGDQHDPPVTLDRGAAVTAMGTRLRQFLSRESESGRVAGVLGIGGSGGTALITEAMRGLPVGLPKLMVSTVASGNTAPYVDCSDITMMYSVVDVSGLNRVLRRVLANAANAMAGMVTARHDEPVARPTIGMTMFGVTTECVTTVQKALTACGFDCLVFHATGSGGRAMEKLVASGLIEGVLDITTTEIADEVVGGVFPAGPDRMQTILKQQIPYVVSLGALDMVNFGERETVPARFDQRNLYAHNAQVTLMRTTPDENRAIARKIAEKLNRATSPVVLLIPEQGLSAMDQHGQPFHDPVADAALFDELEANLQQNAHWRLVRLPVHINDRSFSETLVDTFLQLREPVVDNQNSTA